MKPAPPGPLLQALTTEHFTLQTARSATIADTHGRASLYLSTVSSAVVALALIGQVSRVGQAFFLFALAILPALLVLGVLTYLRLIDSSIEDAFYARAINRIRHAYIDADHTTQRYLLLSGHDDLSGVMRNMGMASAGSRWHLLSHTASMVLLVNAVIGGVFVALAVRAADLLPLPAAVGLAVLVAAAAVAGQMRHQARRWRAAEAAIPPSFPSELTPTPRGYNGADATSTPGLVGGTSWRSPDSA